jgi:hypothetical protein
VPAPFGRSRTVLGPVAISRLTPSIQPRRSFEAIGQTRAAARLDVFLAGLGHQTIARLRDTLLYNEATLRGLGVFDLSGVRAASYQGEWLPILQLTAAIYGRGGPIDTRDCRAVIEVRHHHREIAIRRRRAATIAALQRCRK